MGVISWRPAACCLLHGLLLWGSREFLPLLCGLGRPVPAPPVPYRFIVCWLPARGIIDLIIATATIINNTGYPMC